MEWKSYNCWGILVLFCGPFCCHLYLKGWVEFLISSWMVQFLALLVSWSLSSKVLWITQAAFALETVLGEPGQGLWSTHCYTCTLPKRPERAEKQQSWSKAFAYPVLSIKCIAGRKTVTPLSWLWWNKPWVPAARAADKEQWKGQDLPCVECVPDKTGGKVSIPKKPWEEKNPKPPIYTM